MVCSKKIARATPGSDLASRPVGVLDQDHRHIEDRLEILALVLDALPADGTLTPSQAHVFTEALDYFAREACWHTRDEEQCLFPCMRAAGDSRLAAALSRLANLEQEHTAILDLHAQLDTAARTGLRAGKFPQRQKTKLPQLLAALEKVYRRHMQVEDRVVFPQAAAVLGLRRMKKIDQEIMRRRTIGRAD